MIDHLTRFSSAKICRSKKPSEIIKGVIESWVSVFGCPGKFLMDNGREFANEEMMKTAEAMNIRILHTSAESPWSNGLVEKHNGTLKYMLEKICADKKVDVTVALPWAVQAKNCLDNVHGFSPAQLTFGQNPSLPSVLGDQPPALEETDPKDVVAVHLEALRKARQAFVEAESSEKIKRALRHNIRPSVKNIFVPGDTVYYKRNDSRKWRGPGKVIGIESSTILIKHGAQYIKAHICRVLPAKGVYYDGKGQECLPGLQKIEEEKKNKEEADQSTEKIEDEEEERRRGRSKY